jgi:hypothetical protein
MLLMLYMCESRDTSPRTEHNGFDDDESCYVF